MEYIHFIVTRFNLPIFKQRDNGEVVDNCNSTFLDSRFGVFEKYCLPSIINQSCQNFKWLVLFDVNTPRKYKLRLEKYHAQYNNLIPCYLDINAYDSDSKAYIESYGRYYSKLQEEIVTPH